MNKFLLTIASTVILIGNLSAMDSDKYAKKGRKLMHAVYEAMQAHLDNGTFSLADIEEYKKFPTQTSREILQEGKKKDHVSETAKIEGLINFFNEQFGSIAVAYMAKMKKYINEGNTLAEIKDKVCADPASVAEDLKQLEQADALLVFLTFLLDTITESNGKRSKPLSELNATLKNDIETHKLSYSRLNHIIEQIKNEPARREQEEKKRLEEERKKREREEQEEREREERQRREKEEQEKKERLRAQAKALYDTDEGRALRTPLMRLLHLIEARIKTDTITKADINYLHHYFWYPMDIHENQKGDRSEIARYMNYLTLIRFFNDGFSNTVITYLSNKKDPKTWTEVDEQLSDAVTLLAKLATTDASMLLDEEVIATKEITTLRKTLPETASLRATFHTGVHELLRVKENYFTGLLNDKRSTAYALHSNDIRKMVGAYGVSAIIDSSDTILLLGGSINDRINDVDPAVEAKNPLIESDSFDDLKRLLEAGKTKTSAFIMLDVGEAKCSLTTPIWLSELAHIVKPALYIHGNNLTLLVSKSGDTISYRLYDINDEYTLSAEKQAAITAFFMPPKKGITPVDLNLGSGVKTDMNSTPKSALNKSFFSKLFNWRVLVPITCIVGAAVGALLWQKYGQKKPAAKKAS